MSLRDCYKTLGLEPGVDMASVKRAYRRLAFSLHPDLNPDVPEAARRFQEVNEAYVQLSQAAAASKARREAASAEQGPDSARAREEAHKAYSKARKSQGRAGSGSASPPGSGQGAARGKDDVLRDILNDPFARRVFEDIYSHIRKDDRDPSPASGGRKEAAGKIRPGREKKAAASAGAGVTAPVSEMFGKVKGWLRRQIDDEQVLRLPGPSLVPGARVRLEIQHGLGGESQVVEITLPPEFMPGKAMRLKGMGRRLGSLRGDLYVRIEAL